MTVDGHIPMATMTSEIPLMGPVADAQDFRQTMGSFPTPVAVVTALDSDGVPRGLTCSAVCSVSMDPPSMLVCVNRRNGSLDAIRHSGGFVINLLCDDRQHVSDVFASASPQKFADAEWQPSPISGLPHLHDDSLAFVDCRLQAEIVAGSHAILIGTVRSSGAGGRTPDSGPLVYYARSYGRWAPSLSVEDELPGRS
ncbi:flavin reductase family protein [Streptomyces sp. CA-111067]|uniref:flavin reductase family protein n=1 Tax=Streptomyces sp. CA-111067 TaxID=3240046 RepID=UPI003D96BFFB